MDEGKQGDLKARAETVEEDEEVSPRVVTEEASPRVVTEDDLDFVDELTLRIILGGFLGRINYLVSIVTEQIKNDENLELIKTKLEFMSEWATETDNAVATYTGDIHFPKDPLPEFLGLFEAINGINLSEVDKEIIYRLHLILYCSFLYIIINPYINLTAENASKAQLLAEGMISRFREYLRAPEKLPVMYGTAMHENMLDYYYPFNTRLTSIDAFYQAGQPMKDYDYTRLRPDLFKFVTEESQPVHIKFALDPDIKETLEDTMNYIWDSIVKQGEFLGLDEHNSIQSILSETLDSIREGKELSNMEDSILLYRVYTDLKRNIITMKNIIINQVEIRIENLLKVEGYKLVDDENCTQIIKTIRDDSEEENGSNILYESTGINRNGYYFTNYYKVKREDSADASSPNALTNLAKRFISFVYKKSHINLLDLSSIIGGSDINPLNQSDILKAGFETMWTTQNFGDLITRMMEEIFLGLEFHNLSKTLTQSIYNIHPFVHYPVTFVSKEEDLEEMRIKDWEISKVFNIPKIEAKTLDLANSIDIVINPDIKSFDIESLDELKEIIKEIIKDRQNPAETKKNARELLNMIEYQSVQDEVDHRIYMKVTPRLGNVEDQHRHRFPNPPFVTDEGDYLIDFFEGNLKEYLNWSNGAMETLSPVQDHRNHSSGNTEWDDLETLLKYAAKPLRSGEDVNNDGSKAAKDFKEIFEYIRRACIKVIPHTKKRGAHDIQKSSEEISYERNKKLFEIINLLLELMGKMGINIVNIINVERDDMYELNSAAHLQPGKHASPTERARLLSNRKMAGDADSVNLLDDFSDCARLVVPDDFCSDLNSDLYRLIYYINVVLFNTERTAAADYTNMEADQEKYKNLKCIMIPDPNFILNKLKSHIFYIVSKKYLIENDFPISYYIVYMLLPHLHTINHEMDEEVRLKFNLDLENEGRRREAAETRAYEAEQAARTFRHHLGLHSHHSIPTLAAQVPEFGKWIREEGERDARVVDLIREFKRLASSPLLSERGIGSAEQLELRDRLQKLEEEPAAVEEEAAFQNSQHQQEQFRNYLEEEYKLSPIELELSLLIHGDYQNTELKKTLDFVTGKYCQLVKNPETGKYSGFNVNNDEIFREEKLITDFPYLRIYQEIKTYPEVKYRPLESEKSKEKSVKPHGNFLLDNTEYILFFFNRQNLYELFTYKSPDLSESKAIGGKRYGPTVPSTPAGPIYLTSLKDLIKTLAYHFYKNIDHIKFTLDHIIVQMIQYSFQVDERHDLEGIGKIIEEEKQRREMYQRDIDGRREKEKAIFDWIHLNYGGEIEHKHDEDDEMVYICQYTTKASDGRWSEGREDYLHDDGHKLKFYHDCGQCRNVIQSIVGFRGVEGSGQRMPELMKFNLIEKGYLKAYNEYIKYINIEKSFPFRLLYGIFVISMGRAARAARAHPSQNTGFFQNLSNGLINIGGNQVKNLNKVKDFMEVHDLISHQGDSRRDVDKKFIELISEYYNPTYFETNFNDNPKLFYMTIIASIEYYNSKNNFFSLFNLSSVPIFYDAKDLDEDRNHLTLPYGSEKYTIEYTLTKISNVYDILSYINSFDLDSCYNIDPTNMRTLIYQIKIYDKLSKIIDVPAKLAAAAVRPKKHLSLRIVDQPEEDLSLYLIFRTRILLNNMTDFFLELMRDMVKTDLDDNKKKVAMLIEFIISRGRYTLGVKVNKDISQMRSGIAAPPLEYNVDMTRTAPRKSQSVGAQGQQSSSVSRKIPAPSRPPPRKSRITASDTATLATIGTPSRPAVARMVKRGDSIQLGDSPAVATRREPEPASVGAQGAPRAASPRKPPVKSKSRSVATGTLSRPAVGRMVKRGASIQLGAPPREPEPASVGAQGQQSGSESLPRTSPSVGGAQGEQSGSEPPGEYERRRHAAYLMRVEDLLITPKPRGVIVVPPSLEDNLAQAMNELKEVNEIVGKDVGLDYGWDILSKLYNNEGAYMDQLLLRTQGDQGADDEDPDEQGAQGDQPNQPIFSPDENKMIKDIIQTLLKSTELEYFFLVFNNIIQSRSRELEESPGEVFNLAFLNELLDKYNHQVQVMNDEIKIKFKKTTEAREGEDNLLNISPERVVPNEPQICFLFKMINENMGIEWVPEMKGWMTQEYIEAWDRSKSYQYPNTARNRLILLSKIMNITYPNEKEVERGIREVEQITSSNRGGDSDLMFNFYIGLYVNEQNHTLKEYIGEFELEEAIEIFIHYKDSINSLDDVKKVFKTIIPQAEEAGATRAVVELEKALEARETEEQGVKKVAAELEKARRNRAEAQTEMDSAKATLEGLRRRDRKGKGVAKRELLAKTDARDEADKLVQDKKRERKIRRQREMEANNLVGTLIQSIEGNKSILKQKYNISGFKEEGDEGESVPTLQRGKSGGLRNRSRSRVDRVDPDGINMRDNMIYTEKEVGGTTYKIPDLLNCFEDNNKVRLQECNEKNLPDSECKLYHYKWETIMGPPPSISPTKPGDLELGQIVFCHLIDVASPFNGDVYIGKVYQSMRVDTGQNLRIGFVNEKKSRETRSQQSSRGQGAESIQVTNYITYEKEWPDNFTQNPESFKVKFYVVDHKFSMFFKNFAEDGKNKSILEKMVSEMTGSPISSLAMPRENWESPQVSVEDRATAAPPPAPPLPARQGRGGGYIKSIKKKKSKKKKNRSRMKKSKKKKNRSRMKKSKKKKNRSRMKKSRMKRNRSRMKKSGTKRNHSMNKKSKNKYK